MRKLIGAGKVTMLEGAVGVRREDFENRLQDGGKRVRSTSLGELKSNNSSSSETFSAARRLVLDSVLGRVSNSQAAIVRRKAVHQVITSQEMWVFFNYKPF